MHARAARPARGRVAAPRRRRPARATARRRRVHVMQQLGAPTPALRRRKYGARTDDDDSCAYTKISSKRPTELDMGQALAHLDLSRLLRRLVHEDGLESNNRAACSIEEYKRFLWLLWMYPEQKLLPSKAVDLVWQRHILDTVAYEQDCLALFGEHLHRIYGVIDPDVELEHTRRLYRTAFPKAPSVTSEQLWKDVATVPAAAMASASLPRLPRAQHPSSVASKLEDVEDQDLEWLGTAVAQELPMKQAVCKMSEPLRQIALDDTGATVVEYKKFLRMMIDDHGAWFTPSKLVDELWHRHILDSVGYCNFCERVNGAYLHHTPHYGEPHSFHDPGFTATLKAYKHKFANVPPSSIWGTVGESGGGGGCGGGGCGGGGGGGGSGGGTMVGWGGGEAGEPLPEGCLGYIMILPACICSVICLAVAWPIAYAIFAGSCEQEHQHDAEICFNYDATPIQSNGEWATEGMTLGSCNDLALPDQYGPDEILVDWYSNNRTSSGTGNTCRDYGRERLCKLCDRFPEHVAGSPGGEGWNQNWGTPSDSQYSNGGMTAVVACCACGGGDTPLIELRDCIAADSSCEVVDACRRSKANKVVGVMMAVLVVLALVTVGFCVKKKFYPTADPVEQQASAPRATSGSVKVVVGPSDSHAAKKRVRRKRKKRKDATTDPVAVTVEQQESTPNNTLVSAKAVNPSDPHAAKRRARRKRRKRKDDPASVTVEQHALAPTMTTDGHSGSSVFP